MDENRKKVIKNDLDELMQKVIDSDCDANLKNLFVDTVGSMKILNDSIEDAHARLDNRKEEFSRMLKDFRKLSEEVSESTASQKEQTKVCKKMVDAMNNQIQVMYKSTRRTHLFIGILIAITMVSMFGAVKGATTASSIWNIVKVFIP